MSACRASSVKTNVSHWPQRNIHVAWSEGPSATGYNCSHHLPQPPPLPCCALLPGSPSPGPPAPSSPARGRKGRNGGSRRGKPFCLPLSGATQHTCHLQAPPPARGAGPPPRGAPLPCPGARTGPPPPSPPPSPAPHTTRGEGPLFRPPRARHAHPGVPFRPRPGKPPLPSPAASARPCRTSG